MDIIKSFFAPTKAWKYLGKKPVTIDKKDVFENPREAADRYRGFHTNDWDMCIGCGTCGEICPTNAINMLVIPTLEDEDNKLNERPAIDYGRCTFCALCVDICTSDSLGMSKEYIHISREIDTFFFLPEIDGIHRIVFDSGYQRDEVSELLDLERYEMEHVHAEDRKDSFIEIVKGFSKDMAIAEASRCISCGICTDTCPAQMNIPEYIAGVYQEDHAEAIDQIYKTNPLPGVCGAICTHKCETVCALSNRGEAIAIRWLKLYAVHNAPEDIYSEKVKEKVTGDADGKIAIVGAGPAGLSAAFYLRTLGYDVDVYEQEKKLGGVLRYGIPSYRLPDATLDQDLKYFEEIGIKFHTETRIGKDITMDQLENDFDAVFLGTGYTLSRALRMENSDHEQVKYAMKFLAEARDYARGDGEMPDITESLVIIGGGNVAFDVARTAVRLQEIKYGKSDVSMAALEGRDVLPADLEEIEEGEEEGIKYSFGYGPQSIVVEDGKLTGLKTWKVKAIFDAEGRFNPTFDESDERIIASEQVYIAIGQMQDFEYFNGKMNDKIEVNRGKVTVGEGGQIKELPWLFAGGDIVRGPDAINGIATGHDSATAIDEYLSKKK